METNECVFFIWVYAAELQCRGYYCALGRRQKNFQVGGQRKIDRKIAKYTKNSVINPLPLGQWRKGPKNSKKGQKIVALLNLYLLYLYHV